MSGFVEPAVVHAARPSKPGRLANSIGLDRRVDRTIGPGVQDTACDCFSATGGRCGASACSPASGAEPSKKTPILRNF